MPGGDGRHSYTAQTSSVSTPRPAFLSNTHTRIHTSTQASTNTESKWERSCQQHSITIEYGEHVSISSESTCAFQQTIQHLFFNNSTTVQSAWQHVYSTICHLKKPTPWENSTLVIVEIIACMWSIFESMSTGGSIDMCPRGLVAMANNDPDYHKLETIKSKAKDISSKWVDITNKLPIDLSFVIFYPGWLVSSYHSTQWTIPPLHVSYDDKNVYRNTRGIGVLCKNIQYRSHSSRTWTAVTLCSTTWNIHGI